MLVLKSTGTQKHQVYFKNKNQTIKISLSLNLKNTKQNNNAPLEFENQK